LRFALESFVAIGEAVSLDKKKKEYLHKKAYLSRQVMTILYVVKEKLQNGSNYRYGDTR
jgi:hypothetical protein